MQKIIRFFDILISLSILIGASPILLIVYITCFFDTGSPLYRSVRVGKHKKIFTLYKFRSMHPHTKAVGTHEVNSSNITKLGKFIRKTKIDELPQLWNVLKGEMSMIGPRPCLPNQNEVIAEREKLDVFRVLPGITGLAQLNDIDMSMPEELAETDHDMISNLTLMHYFEYIIATFTGGGSGDRVRG